MRTEITELINKGDYDRVKELIKNIDLGDFEDLLLQYKIDSELSSLQLYSFIVSLIDGREHVSRNATFHTLAGSLMALELCYLEGAYNIALYHTKKAAELCPNQIIYKENLFFFNEIPERLVNNQEALQIATSILKIDPNHQLAKEKILKLSK